MGPWHQFLHILGVDDVSGYWYGFWSGFGGDLTVLAAILAAPVILWRKHDCDIRGCPRLAKLHFKDPETDLEQQLCRKHHPGWPGKKPMTADDLRDRYHIYIGKQRGKG